MQKSNSNSGVFLVPKWGMPKQQSFHITIICVVFFTLLATGMVNLYSASQGIGTGYFYGQLRNLLVTVTAFFVFGWVVPIRKINDYAYWWYFSVVFLLTVVFVLGRIAGGAQRWVAIGPIGFQPSEFAKLATAIIVAKFFSTHKSDKPYRIRDLWVLLGAVGIVFGLIFSQPDFGTAGVCVLIALAQLSFVRIDSRTLLSLGFMSPLAAICGWHFLLRDYQKLRILNLFNPDLDPQNSGYNSLQSLIAIGSGGLFGKGYMQGTQTQLKFLPERHTDFVFSVFAEEHGFWGGTFIFVCFGALTYVALDIAHQVKDTFSGLLAIGVAFFIFFEFIINIAMVLGIFPVVGLPLPFFSYGSSLLLTVCVALGLLVSIKRGSSQG